MLINSNLQDINSVCTYVRMYVRSSEPPQCGRGLLTQVTYIPSLCLALSCISCCPSHCPTPYFLLLHSPMQVLEATKMPNLYERLKGSVELLDKIMKGLNAYLEKKRLYFPRYVRMCVCMHIRTCLDVLHPMHHTAVS